MRLSAAEEGPDLLRAAADGEKLLLGAAAHELTVRPVGVCVAEGHEVGGLAEAVAQREPFDQLAGRGISHLRTQRACLGGIAGADSPQRLAQALGVLLAERRAQNRSDGGSSWRLCWASGVRGLASVSVLALSRLCVVSL